MNWYYSQKSVKEFNHVNITLDRTHAFVGKCIKKNKCFVVMCEMDYFSSLNATGQQKYMDKLRLLELYLTLYAVANSINFVGRSTPHASYTFSMWRWYSLRCYVQMLQA